MSAGGGVGGHSLSLSADKDNEPVVLPSGTTVTCEIYDPSQTRGPAVWCGPDLTATTEDKETSTREK